MAGKKYGMAALNLVALFSSLAWGSTVKSFEKTPSEVTVLLSKGRLSLRPLKENAIRVRFSVGKVSEVPSLVLENKLAPAPEFTVKETKSELILSTAKMKAVVNRETGALVFQDALGKVLLAEENGGRSLKPSKLRGTPVYTAEARFVSQPDERLFGSGQFQDGQLDVRDLPRRLTQVNTQISIPFLLSNKGYGILWHNYGLTDLNPADETIRLSAGGGEGVTTTVDVTTTEGTKKEVRKSGEFIGKFSVKKAGIYAFLLDVGQKMARGWHVEIDGRPVVDFHNFWLPPTTSWRLELASGEHSVKVAGETNDKPVVFFRQAADETVWRSPVAEVVDYTVFAGKPDEVISSYRQVTGKAPLMPKWSLGYIHCRERFHSQQEILENAREFREHKLPMDVMVQDWQYWGSHGWNAMQWDENDYPDPAAMVRELHAMNARLMVSVWSKIDASAEIAKEFIEKKYFIPDTQWVDFFNPEAASLYWNCFSKRMVTLGVDAWWLDATEPENDDLEGRDTYLGPGEKVRNIYPLFVVKTVYEGLRKDAPSKRVFILTRSAFSGQQRYAAATWSGDIGNDWETLRRQITAGLNYSASGLPFWTTDAGGFFRPGDTQYTDPDYHERFLRWFQFVTFCPLQRVHGYQTNTEFWRYGKEVENLSRRYLNLRYQLLPYIYSEAARVTFDGGTLMRPLVMDFTDDATALKQKYEYMFGPSILVSPIVESGVSAWDVYLPKNQGGWFDFWTGEHLEGGQTVKASASLEEIPLHVRAGSIIPYGPSMEFSTEKSDLIELRVYPGVDGSFSLYEDEGDNYNYEKGQFSTIPMTWTQANRTLHMGKRQGEFPGMLKERSFRIVCVSSGKGSGVDHSDKVDAVVHYHGEALEIKLSIE